MSCNCLSGPSGSTSLTEASTKVSVSGLTCFFVSCFNATALDERAVEMWPAARRRVVCTYSENSLVLV